MEQLHLYTLEWKITLQHSRQDDILGHSKWDINVMTQGQLY